MMEAELREKLGDYHGRARAARAADLDLAVRRDAAHAARRAGESGAATTRTALRERRAVLALNPPDPIEARYQLARALAASGDRAAARREVLRVLEQAPSFEKAQALLLELQGRTRSEHALRIRCGVRWAGSPGGRARVAVRPAARMGAGPRLRRHARRARPTKPNVPYDGRFTFARIRYAHAELTADSAASARDVKWAHDYPRGERHFTKIVERDHRDPVAHARRATSSRSTIPSFQVSRRLPVRGRVLASDGEPRSPRLRKYLLKGGFIIFDDFARQHWMNFEAQMQRVLARAAADADDAGRQACSTRSTTSPTLEYTHPVLRAAVGVLGHLREQRSATGGCWR